MNPSEYFNLPVIGKIIVKYPFGDDKDKTTEYEFIDFQDQSTSDKQWSVYVCNKWYKEYKHIPQLIMTDFVIEEIIY